MDIVGYCLGILWGTNVLTRCRRGSGTQPVRVWGSAASSGCRGAPWRALLQASPVAPAASSPALSCATPRSATEGVMGTVDE